MPRLQATLLGLGQLVGPAAVAEGQPEESVEGAAVGGHHPQPAVPARQECPEPPQPKAEEAQHMARVVFAPSAGRTVDGAHILVA